MFVLLSKMFLLGFNQNQAYYTFLYIGLVTTMQIFVTDNKKKVKYLKFLK